MHLYVCVRVGERERVLVGSQYIRFEYNLVMVQIVTDLYLLVLDASQEAAIQ